MARIHIPMPDVFMFETRIRVRVSDINYGRHVGHDALISLIHESRVRFLEHLGYTEADIEGHPLLISDLAAVYESQSFYGDTLRFEIGVGDFNKYGCDFFYRVTHAETGGPVMQAKTGIVFFDIRTGRVAALPEGFVNRLSNPELRPEKSDRS